MDSQDLYYYYVPGYKPGYIENAINSTIKNVIFCLEDGTPQDKKREARVVVKNALRFFDQEDKTFIVRINGVETSMWKKDIDYIINYKSLSRIRIPMLRTASDFKTVLDYIISKTARVPKLEVMIENLQIFSEIDKLLSFSEFIYCFTVGGEDLMDDIRKTTDEPDKKYAEIKTALGRFCADNGMPCFDTTYMDYKNLDGFEADCIQSKKDFYTGRSIIHPNQIEIVKRVYGTVI